MNYYDVITFKCLYLIKITRRSSDMIFFKPGGDIGLIYNT